MAEESKEERQVLRTLSTLYLDEPVCCMANVPSHHGYFLVGTYNLLETKSKDSHDAPDKIDDPILTKSDGGADNTVGAHTNSAQNRSGSLVLIFINQGALKLEIVQTVPCKYAVLDIQFVEESSKFGVAMSNGNMGFGACCAIDIDDPDTAVGITQLMIQRISSPSDVITSLAWHPLNDQYLAATASSGKVYMVQLSGDVLSWDEPAQVEGRDSTISVAVTSVAKHDLEAWCVCFTDPDRDYMGELKPEDEDDVEPSNGVDADDPAHSGASPSKGIPNEAESSESGFSDDEGSEVEAYDDGSYSEGIWTGGDDVVLRYTNLPANLSSRDDALPMTFKKCHDAGIIAIRETLTGCLLTGSYDDKLRVVQFDSPTRGLVQRVRTVAELDLGGGVWKISDIFQVVTDDKPHVYQFRLLVCCMYAGAKVVEVRRHEEGEDEWEMQVIASFDEHKSMVYAGEVFEDPEDLKAPSFVTGSFYDKRICWWQPDLDDIVSFDWDEVNADPDADDGSMFDDNSMSDITLEPSTSSGPDYSPQTSDGEDTSNEDASMTDRSDTGDEEILTHLEAG
ncbi:MAG: hypothetical protein M1828_004441 [Chrysothrix sp. TS-e1954]|nr:MAG: hypothetical protein M1828_004441 [Chrysothrix sp. TS-e1954]